MTTTTTYPPPPPYYRLYKDYIQNPKLASYPPPPIEGTYVLFGGSYIARATLIHMLELQIQCRKEAMEDIKRRREEAQRLLKEALGTLDGH
ncbi:Mediator of RNA polymerase II transcription subunit 7a [Camellia lanceoleosa]|uniref:Mediator of RNA polymerase II transcription subunit 7a n=1 Tax=Camellia lanceoleosa TaxID=1840588 RepID=A0ACC0GB66_9ERIC|nr:Mediator of RNA polymerase II transcription subunit 7a [Camellia lanceoleosa]